MNHEVEVIHFKSESDQIHVQLPKTDSNLDIMINIIQGMKQNNGAGIKQNIKANALHNTLNDNDQGIALNNTIKQSNDEMMKQSNNDIIKSLNNETIKENSELENQVKELLNDLWLQREDNESTTSIQVEPVGATKTIQGPDETLTRPSKGLDKSLTKNKKEKKKKSSGKKKGFPYILADDQVLVKNMDTDTRSISVYKPVVKYLLENLDDDFASRDIRDGIFSCFNDVLGRKLKKSSAHTYVADYRQYLVDMGFVEQFDNNRYRFTQLGLDQRKDAVERKPDVEHEVKHEVERDVKKKREKSVMVS